MAETPWHVEHRGDKWAVVKDSDGSVSGTHDSEEKAKRQLAALYANEPAARTSALERVAANVAAFGPSPLDEIIDRDLDALDSATTLMDAVEAELERLDGEPSESPITASLVELDIEMLEWSAPAMTAAPTNAEWWEEGSGIDWGAEGSFTACVALAEGKVDDPEAFCATRYHEATGEWPGAKHAAAQMARVAALAYIAAFNEEDYARDELGRFTSTGSERALVEGGGSGIGVHDLDYRSDLRDKYEVTVRDGHKGDAYVPVKAKDVDAALDQGRAIAHSIERNRDWDLVADAVAHGDGVAVKVDGNLNELYEVLDQANRGVLAPAGPDQATRRERTEFLGRSASFDEDAHPRDERGRFTSEGGGGYDDKFTARGVSDADRRDSVLGRQDYSRAELARKEGFGEVIAKADYERVTAKPAYKEALRATRESDQEQDYFAGEKVLREKMWADTGKLFAPKDYELATKALMIDVYGLEESGMAIRAAFDQARDELGRFAAEGGLAGRADRVERAAVERVAAQEQAWHHPLDKGALGRANDRADREIPKAKSDDAREGIQRAVDGLNADRTPNDVRAMAEKFGGTLGDSMRGFLNRVLDAEVKARTATFDEALHPRDDQGRFTAGDSSQGGHDDTPQYPGGPRGDDFRDLGAGFSSPGLGITPGEKVGISEKGEITTTTDLDMTGGTLTVAGGGAQETAGIFNEMFRDDIAIDRTDRLGLNEAQQQEARASLKAEVTRDLGLSKMEYLPDAEIRHGLDRAPAGSVYASATKDGTEGYVVKVPTGEHVFMVEDELNKPAPVSTSIF